MFESEIVTGCRRRGLPRPPTLPNIASDAGDAGAAGPAGAAGAAPPAGDGDSTPPPPWLEDMLRTLAMPETVVFAHRQDTGAVAEIRLFAMSAPWAVEQTPGPQSTHALVLLDAGQVMDRVVSFCRLVDRTTATAAACEVAGSTFLLVMARAPADVSGAMALLRADGIATREAQALAEALALSRTLAQVTVVHRPTAGRLVGATTSWLDGGPAGLWLVEAPKLAKSGDYGGYGDMLLEQVSVRVAPVTKEALLTEIERGFPAAEVAGR